MTSSNIFRVTAPSGGSPPVTGGFPSRGPVTRIFNVFFDLRLNKQLSKQWRRRLFETPSRSSWCHCNAFYETEIDSTCLYKFTAF